MSADRVPDQTHHDYFCLDVDCLRAELTRETGERPGDTMVIQPQLKNKRPRTEMGLTSS